MKRLATTGLALSVWLVAHGSGGCGGSEFSLADAGDGGQDASSDGSGGSSGGGGNSSGVDAGGCKLSSDCHGPLPALCELCPDGASGCAHWECRGGVCVTAYCTGAGIQDAGCVSAGASCVGATCCGGLSCCSGVPIPVGQSYCGIACPRSDWHVKAGFAPVESEAVLDAVASLPLSKWRYQSEPPEVQHIGPMAQDFKAAFGVGADDKHIFQIDADGVSFAAIQALAHKLDALTASQQALERENADLRAQVQKLETRMLPEQASCPAP
jgi:endosialidase-like protein